MGDKRIADYFVIAGVPAHPRKFDDSLPTIADPITDIAVIIRSHNEPVPKGYVCIEETPTGQKADLNHGSIRSPSVFLCIKRGRDKPPLVDIGVFFNEGKERLIPHCQVIKKTPSGFPANVNNSGTETFITFRRSTDDAPANQLVVTDICVILANKNETPPHAYMLIDKNLNKGMFGSDVYLCYKKSMDRPPFLSFTPVIIDRFPLEDYPDFSLSEHLPNFCLPMGASIECWPRRAHKPYPSFSTFVLTLNSGEKIYASLLNFYETTTPDELTRGELKHLRYIEDDLAEEEDVPVNEEKSLHRIKSICLLSRWPFFDQFKRFLTFLCKTFCASSIPPLTSLESYIFYFMRDIPFPSPERPNILVNLCHSSDEVTPLLFTQTFDDLPIPSNGASFKRLLFNLGPENCLHVMLFALTEQKILLHSLRPSVLTEVAEAITTMIFPFNWHCPYIPMCPMSMSQYLHAPMPFIFGIDSRYFDYCVPPNEVASIDIDTKAIYLSESKRFLNLKMLPKKETRALRTTLEGIFDRLKTSHDTSKMTDMNAKRKMDKQIETEIQEAFLYFMASILKDFRHFLKPITAAPRVGATDPTSLFDMQGFLHSRDLSCQPFFEGLLKTQMFTKFIEERSLVSDKNVSLAFFDECIEKVEKYEKQLAAFKSAPVGTQTASPSLTLIDFDDQSNVNKTVFITIPDSMPLSPKGKESPREKTKYVPDIFGPLNHQKFYKLVTDHSSSRNSFAQLDSNSACPAFSEDYPDSVEFNSELQTYIFARRAKHEIRKAQKTAQQACQSPVEWSKHLLVNAYSLWFTHFPAFSHVLLSSAKSDSKLKPLSLAYQVLQRMQALSISSPDEFCYRILMILCGIHSQPALAVKVFLDMQKHQVRLNAITYGYYNKAVLEGNWPTDHRHAKWAKLRNTCRVVFHLKRHIKLRSGSRNHVDVPPSENVKASWASQLNDIERLPKATEKPANGALRNDSSATKPDYSESAGLLITTQTHSQSPPHSPKVNGGSSPHLRKRHRSDGSTPSSVNGDIVKPIDSHLNGNGTSTMVAANGDTDSTSSNLESSKSDLHPETASESSVKDGSEENLNDSFSSRFATPIKEAFTTMDFFSPKSRFGLGLRSSFRIAKSLTKSSKYGFPRSSTFHNSEKSLNKTGALFNHEEGDLRNVKSASSKLPRSSTLPQSFASQSNSSSMTVTPTKSDSRPVPNSGSATVSPWANKLSSGKHSEYLYSTYKLAANRINELKSSFAATSNVNSPVKLNMANVMASSGTYLFSQFKNFVADDEDTLNGNTLDTLNGNVDEGYETLEKYADLFDTLSGHYSAPIEVVVPNQSALSSTSTSPPETVVFRVQMMSCSICRGCSCIVYDEEIMCQWGAEDSNLNTKCIHCNCTFVPSLTISIQDHRNGEGAIDEKTFKCWEPASVPYLSPLVLRKELETILNSEGYTSLIRCKFVDDHPIVYWNLLWYFTRLNLPSHISALALSALSLNSPESARLNQQFGYDFRNVSIVCLWDSEKLYQNTPLHRRWLKLKNNDEAPNSPEGAIDPTIFPQLFDCIRNGKVATSIKYLISERSTEKMKVSGVPNSKFNSIYRELLFLTILEVGDNISSVTFDKEYHDAYESLTSKERESLGVLDKPSTIGRIFCRSLFKQLSLLR